MATNYFKTGLQLKICPYDRGHKVKSSRFQAHVSECAKRHSKGLKTPLKECPFNSEHRMTEDKYEEHILMCPDNRQFFRRDCLVLKKAKTEHKEEEEEDYRMKGGEDWSDEYRVTTHSTNDSSQNYCGYGVLHKQDEVTAEWLFDQRFKVNKDKQMKTFTDTIFIQLMSNEERRKYYSMSVQKIKEDKQKQSEQEMDYNFEDLGQKETDEQNNEITSEEMPSTDGFRVPNTRNPFSKRLKSIGRGIGISLERGVGKRLPKGRGFPEILN